MPSRLPLAELSRFALVALLCGGLYLGVLSALAMVTPWAIAARAALAYLPAVLVNYLLQRSFTFRSQRHHVIAGPRFVAVQFGGMLINSAGLWLGMDGLGWSFAFAQAFSIAALGVFSYFGQKFWAFGTAVDEPVVEALSASTDDDTDRA